MWCVKKTNKPVHLFRVFGVLQQICLLGMVYYFQLNIGKNHGRLIITLGLSVDKNSKESLL